MSKSKKEENKKTKETPKTFLEKLVYVQQKLKAPKNQKNDFGKYTYRSAEDILEAVKPLLGELNLYLKLSDEIVEIGGKTYVRAVATVRDNDQSESATAQARESENRKGMDDAQITGATSSYARKYALNGLFGIDDNKDADTNEYTKQKTLENSAPKAPTPKPKTETPESKKAVEIYTSFTTHFTDRQQANEQWKELVSGKDVKKMTLKELEKFEGEIQDFLIDKIEIKEA